MKFKYKARKPTRELACGFSSSELKTLVKRRGFKVSREFPTTNETVAYKNNRLYRFRWWNPTVGFVIDKSCLRDDFDRWANSVDEEITFSDFLTGRE